MMDNFLLWFYVPSLILGALFIAFFAHKQCRALSQMCQDGQDELFAERVSSQLGTNRGMLMTVAMIQIVAFYVIADHYTSLPWWQATTCLMFSVFVMVVSLEVGNFSIRRTIFEETWSLASYLRHRAAMLIASPHGAFIFVLAAPFLVSISPDHGTFDSACAWSLVAAIWWHGRMTFLSPTPLTDAKLTERFESISDRSEIEHPHVHVIGPFRGGKTVSDLCRQVGKRSSVYLSRPLLNLLDDDEAEAIFASNVASLEKPYSALTGFLWFLLVLIGCFLYPVIRIYFPAAHSVIFSGWIGFLAISIWLLSRNKDCQCEKKQQRTLDQRTVDLCRNGHAFVRALTKIAKANLIPLGGELTDEQSASTPTLAERIRDIHVYIGESANVSAKVADSKSTVAMLPVFQSRTEANKFLLIEDEAVHWLEFSQEDTKLLLDEECSSSEIWKQRARAVQSYTFHGLADLRFLMEGRNGAIQMKTDRTKAVWNQYPQTFLVKKEDEVRAKQVLDATQSKIVYEQPENSDKIRFAGPRLATSMVVAIAAYAIHGGTLAMLPAWILLMVAIPALIWPRYRSVVGAVALLIVLVCSLCFALAPDLFQSPPIVAGRGIVGLLLLSGLACLWPRSESVPSESEELLVESAP